MVEGHAIRLAATTGVNTIDVEPRNRFAAVAFDVFTAGVTRLIEFRVLSVRDEVITLDVIKFDVVIVFPTKFWAI